MKKILAVYIYNDDIYVQQWGNLWTTKRTKIY